MQELIKIGRARLRVIGLNPQRISYESETRWPGVATWRDMDHQKTGRGEQRLQLDVKTAPHVFGGLDALEWLKRHHRQQDVVNYLRLGRNFLGQREGAVTIRALYIDETKLHPFDGIGRIVEAQLDLILFGDPG